MKNLIKVIQESIMDVCLESYVEDGVFDPTNENHIFGLIEKLEEKQLNEQIIREAVVALRGEGKYPDRQAYNKEGWLVTFPSAEYKKRAIQKGTHFASDPTHGKGGMHLYYKKKGKTKRMTHQDASQTENPQIQQKPQPAPQAPQQQATQQPAPAEPKAAPEATGGEEDDAPIDFKSQYDKDPSALPRADADAEDNQQASPEAEKPQDASAEKPEKQQAQQPEAPAASAPVSPPSPPSYVNVSVDFAKNKQWNPTQYGEWRNQMGDTVAVVGLSGEVVPIKNTDREELKLFAKKNGSQ